jgi:hypothetical protein
MDIVYKTALDMIRDARKKRGKISFTAKFFDTLKKVNRLLPSFNTSYKPLRRAPPLVDDDIYSTELMRAHAPWAVVRGRVAKWVNANGNCLFNAISLALIGKICILLILAL